MLPGCASVRTETNPDFIAVDRLRRPPAE
jgi:hypothetical protein